MSAETTTERLTLTAELVVERCTCGRCGISALVMPRSIDRADDGTWRPVVNGNIPVPEGWGWRGGHHQRAAGLWCAQCIADLETFFQTKVTR